MKQLSGLVALSIAFSAVLAVFGMTFSWVFITETLPVEANGKIRGYNFDMTVDPESNGTLQHPFYITRPSHLINLQKLQNENKLNDSTYYFAIGKPTSERDTNLCTYGTDTSTVCTARLGLDMTGTEMEPIGNDSYPFIGVLEGNSFAISNANVINPTDTNNNATYTDIGLFGTIGVPVPDSVAESVLTRVSNLAVDKITIESSRATTGSQVYIGLIAGNVQSGTIEHIGAYQGRIIHNESRTLSSFRSDYSLIGRKADNVDMDENPTAGEDAGGRLVLDIYDLYKDPSIGALLDTGKYATVEGATNSMLTLTGQMRFNVNKPLSIVKEIVSGTDKYSYVYANGQTSRGSNDYIPAEELFVDSNGVTDQDGLKDISERLYEDQLALWANNQVVLPNMRFNNNYRTNLVDVLNKNNEIIKVYQRVVFFRPVVDGYVRALCFLESSSDGFGLAPVAYSGISPTNEPATSDFIKANTTSVTKYKDSNGNTTKSTATSNMFYYFRTSVKANTSYILCGASGVASGAFVFYVDFDGVSDTGGSAGGSIASIDFTLTPNTIPDINANNYVYSYVLIRFNDETETILFEISYSRDSGGVHVTAKKGTENVKTLNPFKSGGGNATYNGATLL